MVSPEEAASTAAWMVRKTAPGQSAPSSSTSQVRWETFAAGVATKGAKGASSAEEPASRSSTAGADADASAKAKTKLIESRSGFMMDKGLIGFGVSFSTLAYSIKNANRITNCCAPTQREIDWSCAFAL